MGSINHDPIRNETGRNFKEKETQKMPIGPSVSPFCNRGSEHEVEDNGWQFLNLDDVHEEEDASFVRIEDIARLDALFLRLQTIRPGGEPDDHQLT